MNLIDARSVPWRADGYLVWAQAGEEPGPADMKVATFTDPALALEAVRAHNSAVAGL